MFNQSSFGGYNKQSAIVSIKVGRGLYDYRPSLWFHEEYYPLDANDNRYVDPGLVVAKALVTDGDTGATYKYVPYEPGGSYGTGSDTPIGILDIRLNATLEAEAIAPLYHGQLLEDKIYVLGQTWADVSSDVKTALPDIDWV